MNLSKANLTIRNAMASDAPQLCEWWNDGKIMAHAGFPKGLGTTADEIRKSLAIDNDETHRRHVIEHDGKPIGEMNYRNKENGVAQIGIKICDFTQQEKGLGTTLLKIFIDALFTYYGYEKIILDTNVKNKRAQHVYENKLGFKFVRINENAWRDQLGEMQAAIDYELMKGDWQLAKKNVCDMKRNSQTQNHSYVPEYFHIREENPGNSGNPADHYAVENLTREAFWNTNRGIGDADSQICDEHLLVHRLRKSPVCVPELNLVAELEGKIVGHIIYAISKVKNDSGNSHEVLTFGPLSVHPNFQNKGIGKALMRHSFRIAKELNYKAVLIFGHADYYPRVGFRRAAEFNITDANGNSYDPFMAYPLYDGALNGIHGRFHIDPVYETLTQKDALEFDKKFPPKARHIPASIEILLNRLHSPAKEAIDALNFHSLAMMQTKSVREILALKGIDAAAIEAIRDVMKENNLPWGCGKPHLV